MFAEFKEMNFLDQGNYLDEASIYNLFSTGFLNARDLARWMELHKKMCENRT